MNKQLIRFSVFFICVIALLVSCEDEKFNEDLLVGKWYSSELNLYYTFNSNHEGSATDKDNHGTVFSWSLDGDRLEMRNVGQGVNVVAYETFIITSLTSSEMKCHDAVSQDKYTFKKN